MKSIRISLFLLIAMICLTGKGYAEIIPLDGVWQLSFWPQPQQAVRDLAGLGAVDAQKIPAHVPGNVEWDLQQAGLVPDPMLGSNVYALRQYEGHQWSYSRTFRSPRLKAGQQVVLHFGGIDCLADIWLNGELIGSPENMLISHEYDVTNLLVTDGENELIVILRSAVLEAQRYLLGPFSTGSFAADESIFVRKAPHGYGWDIMPRIVTAGLWRSVNLQVKNAAQLADVNWLTSRIDVGRKTARVFVDVQARLPFAEYDKASAVIRLSHEGKEVYRQKVTFLSHAFRHEINLADVKFWWPRGYGDASLYDAEVILLDGDGKQTDRDQRKIGVRTVRLDMTDINDQPGKPGKFEFVVNGVSIFVRGTNWVPLDGLHARDTAHVEKTLALVADLNCNMIRVWGGSVYEGRDFFELCDREGIMVWQDFAMGCAFYPQREPFVTAVRDEVTHVVKAFRSHPSLVLWAGNNENDLSLRWSIADFNIDPNRDVVTRQLIPQLLYELDPTRPYLPSSPYYSQAVYDAGGHDDLLPENHLWGPRGYYKDKFYTDAKAKFVSEIGYHGVPNRSSLEQMFSADAVYPWNPAGEWNDEWLTKSVRMLPQSAKTNGRNNLMTNQVKILFGEVPSELDDFIAASQIVQAEAMKYFIEFWRGDKPGRSGIIWWNVRDGWPILSDAIVDYYYSKKLAYQFIKNVQHDVCVFLNDARDGLHPLQVSNDTRQTATGTVHVTDVATGRQLAEHSFEVPANGKVHVGNVAQMRGQGILLIEYTVNGQAFKNHYTYGEPPFRLATYQELLKKTGIYNAGE